VVGPSGSGKSTLALAIAGLIPREIPAAMTGQLELDGRDVRELGPSATAAQVGIVFQDPSAQLVMDRVEDDIAFGLENRGWSLEEMRARVPEAAALVGLAGFERRRSRRLSGGEQQRLALAGVLAARPGVLVLDEPTANLDPVGTAAFFERIRAVRDERSTTMVLIEHRVEHAWSLADTILALDASGRPIDAGPAAEVTARSARAMHDAGIWLPADVEASLVGVEPSTAPAAAPSTSPPAASSVPAAAPSAPTPAAPSTGIAVLRASDVRYGFDRRAEPVVRDITFGAAAGERIALVGPNGSGKSTLARLLVGLVRPDFGTVDLLGADPARLPPRELAARAAYVFQEPERQFLAERVADEVRLGLTGTARDDADALMERLGLPLGRFGERSPYRLSGGEQRRLSLASALVRDPAVLILDEPTFGQDRLGYEDLLTILHEHVSAGACLIAATHDERFVRDIAGRVVELDAGWIVRDELIDAGGLEARP
jgi:energy-coupling factor transport system ATP-binding protein